MHCCVSRFAGDLCFCLRTEDADGDWIVEHERLIVENLMSGSAAGNAEVAVLLGLLSLHVSECMRTGLGDCIRAASNLRRQPLLLRLFCGDLPAVLRLHQRCCSGLRRGEIGPAHWERADCVSGDLAQSGTLAKS